MVVVNVKFRDIRVNTTPSGREIVFRYGDQWFRMGWENVPDRFKELYVAYLKLMGFGVPEDLSEFDRETYDIGDGSVEIDIDKAIKIHEIYPIG